MHRVNHKKRRTVILRFIAYGITLTLSIITTLALVYLALGYRIDSRGSVTKSGLVLVNAQPDTAQVSIDGASMTDLPGRFLLMAGEHSFVIQRAGYHTWNKTITVDASTVEDVRYPLLIPQELKSTSLATYEAPSLVAQSPDKKMLLMQSATDKRLLLIQLNPEKIEQQALTLGSYATKENGQTGTVRLLDWNNGNKFVLVEHLLPSGLKEVLSFDVTKPSEGINLSKLYPTTTFSRLHYRGNKTDQVYTLADSAVLVLNLKDSTVETLLRKVKDYVPYGEDTLLFTRLGPEGTTLESGIHRDKKEVIVQSSPVTGDQLPLMEYGSYEGEEYLVLSSPGDGMVTIYRNPLKGHILKDQLPFKQFELPAIDQIKFSPSGRFVLMKSNDTVIMYDIERPKTYTYQVPIALKVTEKIQWISDFHILVSKEAEGSYLIDFDGTNQQQLAKSSPNTGVYFAPDRESFYHFTHNEQRYQLQTTPLIIEE